MITPKDAANVINYLLAAQTISVVDNQDAVWADYINAEVPDARQDDLLPAAREAINAWVASGRGWRIDVGRYVAALNGIRVQRLQDTINAYGGLEAEGVDDPMTAVMWKRVAVRAIMSGASRAEAERHAYEKIGVPAPAVAATEHLDVEGILRAATHKIGH